jgi:uncharacterized Fe-S center protein
LGTENRKTNQKGSNKGENMMKKRIALFTVFLLICSLCACGQRPNSQDSGSTQDSSSTQDSTSQESASRETVPAAQSSAETPTANSTTITTNGGYSLNLSALEHENSSSSSTVYYINDISSDALMKIYASLGRAAAGKVAVKLSTGEAGDTYYLDPQLIRALVQSVDGTIVECNTAYGGSRSSTAMHLQVAKDHGFTDIASVDIMDADGSMSIPVTGGKHLTEDLVGAHLAGYDFVMVLSHFKGHVMAGFGGALKNISIGIGSVEGKALIHGAGDASKIWSANQDDFTESMAEAAKAVSDYEGNGEKMLYISVMNNLSVDCDCDSSPAAPTMKNVGILASTDPVALDQACVDFVYAVPDGKDLIARMESRNGVHILEHAEEIGLGSRDYRLVDIGA